MRGSLDRHRLPRAVFGTICAALLLAAGVAPAGAQGRTRSVFFIVTDGVRWQEIFRGAELAQLGKDPGGVDDTAAARRAWWRDSAADRREALVPFLWRVVARQGQLFGNRDAGSVARVTNGLNFSYPGYNEMLTGSADPRIDSNDKTPNPNVTVLEWLNGRKAWRGRVAAFGTWDVFPSIFNRPRSGLPTLAGVEPPESIPGDPAQAQLRRMYADITPVWGDWMSFDALMYDAAERYVRRHKPRVVYIGFGETDEWAHDGRYDLVLASLHRVDDYVARLWALVQSMPEYRGRTTFIITTDHGRGDGRTTWRDHGRKVPESEQIWLAVIGPDTPPLGARHDAPVVTQSQVPATLAALLGEDWRKAEPRAAPPIADVLGSRPR